MKRIRKLGLEAALAAATAAFLAVPASALEKQARTLTHTGGAVLRRRARAGPLVAGKRAKIRIGMWRPAESGTETVTVEVRMLDALTGEVLQTIKKPLETGKGQLVRLDPLPGERVVAFEADMAAQFGTNRRCEEKLTFRISFEVTEGGNRVHESRQVWPCIRGGFIRQ